MIKLNLRRMMQCSSPAERINALRVKSLLYRSSGWMSMAPVPLVTLLALSFLMRNTVSLSAQNRRGPRVAPASGAAKEGAHKFTYLPDRPCPAMEKELKDMDVKSFDDCVYNGATFKEWRKFSEALETARTYCETRKWTGETKFWDVYIREWITVSCKSVKEL